MIKKIFNACIACLLPVCLLCVVVSVNAKDVKKYYYQIKIYHLANESQEKKTGEYLETAYLPALHRAGIKSVGVFTPAKKDTGDQLLYVFIPFKSFTEFEELESKLAKDAQYQTDGKTYIDAVYNDVAYKRFESIILKAFSGMPGFDVPALTAPKPERIYELRSYEGPSEKYYVNKVKMFNDGDEVGLFKRLGFNAVFYAEVLSGSHMPNLMYMTTFNSMEERDKHWDAFGKDPQWKALTAMEYQHNVSKAEIFLLHPTAYSDF